MHILYLVRRVVVESGSGFLLYISMLNVASSDALFPRRCCHFNLLQCFVGLNLDGRPESAANSNSVTFAISIARTKRATDSRADSDANKR